MYFDNDIWRKLITITVYLQWYYISFLEHAKIFDSILDEHSHKVVRQLAK